MRLHAHAFLLSISQIYSWDISVRASAPRITVQVQVPVAIPGCGVCRKLPSVQFNKGYGAHSITEMELLRSINYDWNYWLPYQPVDSNVFYRYPQHDERMHNQFVISVAGGGDPNRREGQCGPTVEAEAQVWEASDMAAQSGEYISMFHNYSKPQFEFIALLL